MNIYVSFYADWASRRDGSGTCWVALPSLYDNGTATVRANTVLGHSEWARGTQGQPLTNGAVFVNYQRSSQLSVNAAASLPAPTSIDPPIWSCTNALGTAGDCQAFAALEESGAADHRLHALVIWSLAGGLLLALLGETLLSTLHGLVDGRNPPQRAKKNRRRR